MNLLTELSNAESGIDIIVRNNYIERLYELIEKSNSQKIKKSAFWILGKLCSKPLGTVLNEKYRIIDYINKVFLTTEDYGLKGTMCYLFSFISSSETMRNELTSYGWQYYFNTNICYPEKFDRIYIQSIEHSNGFSELLDKLNRINTRINLNDSSQEIYNQCSNLLNTITYKQAYDRLKELFKSEPVLFEDPFLVVRVFALLSMYKYRLHTRQFFYFLFDKALSNVEILEKAQKTLEKYDLEML